MDVYEVHSVAYPEHGCGLVGAVAIAELVLPLQLLADLGHEEDRGVPVRPPRGLAVVRYHLAGSDRLLRQ